MDVGDLPWYYYKKPTLEWYFEVRSTTTDSCFDWKTTEWGEWKYEYKIEYSLHHNYMYAKSMLEDFRLRHEPSYCDSWKWEYRATLRKIT